MKHVGIRVAALLVALLAAAQPALAQPQPRRAPAQPASTPARPATPAAPAATTPAATPTLTRPEARELSLGQVLALAARQEPNLARATIDVRIANAAMLEAAGIDDWLLVASGQWSSRVQATGIEEDSPTQSSLSLSGDLSRSLSTGGTVGLHAETNYTNNIPRIANGSLTYTSAYVDTVTATISQPLWSGRGREVARNAQVQARLERDAAVLTRQSVAIETVQALVRAYWDLALAWRSLEIRQNSLLLAHEQLRNTQARIRAGAVAPTEALAVQQTIVSREEEILNAELAITESSLELRRLAGLDVGPGDLNIAVNTSLALMPRSFDMNALLEQALAQSPRLASLEAQEEVLVRAVSVAEDNADPSLDLSASFGPTGTADNAGDALTDMVKFNNFSINAGLTYRQALGNRAARGQREQVRERLAQHRVTMAESRAQLTRELVRAVKQAEAAQKRAELSQQVISLAEQNIQAERARFELGRATNFDVLQRQEELQQAQLRQAQAIIDYFQALNTIEALTGGMLERYGITLEPA